MTCYDELRGRISDGPDSITLELLEILGTRRSAQHTACDAPSVPPETPPLTPLFDPRGDSCSDARGHAALDTASNSADDAAALGFFLSSSLNTMGHRKVTTDCGLPLMIMGS